MDSMYDKNQQNPGERSQGSGTMDSGNTGREYTGNQQQGSSNAGQLIRDNQEKGRYTSVFEEGTADWQDRSTGSMGSQTSGGMTSRKMNAEEPQNSGNAGQQQKYDQHWNRYGQSHEDIQHIKDNEKLIRGGYSETQQTDTNPYLRDMYQGSSQEQLSGMEGSVQQMEGRTSADRYQSQRVTEEGRNEEIGGPMDASKNY